MSRTEKNQRAKTRNAARRAERRKEAEERQAHWASLSPQEQLRELAKRPGQSKKQIARIKGENQ